MFVKVLQHASIAVVLALTAPALLAQSQAPEPFWPGAKYDPSIPTLKQVVGHDHGEEISGDTLLILFNADHVNEIPFSLPALNAELQWERVFDTDAFESPKETFPAGTQYPLKQCSIATFRIKKPEEAEEMM